MLKCEKAHTEINYNISRITDRYVCYQISVMKKTNTNGKARKVGQRKPTTRTSWIQKRVLNDRSGPSHKHIEVQVSGI